MTVTAWCAECDGPADVIDSSWETAPDGTGWWVSRFDCGHEAAVQ